MMCAIYQVFHTSKYMGIYIKMTRIPKSNTLLIKITIKINFPIYKLYILATMWFFRKGNG